MIGDVCLALETGEDVLWFSGGNAGRWTGYACSLEAVCVKERGVLDQNMSASVAYGCKCGHRQSA